MVEDMLVGWVEEVAGVETVILGYIVYEFRYGRGRELRDTLRSFVPAIVVLAQEVETVNENAIIEMMPTNISTPSVFLERDQDGEFDTLSDEQIERLRDELNIKDEGD